MRTKVLKIWILCAVICLSLAVSSCRKRTPVKVAAKEEKAPAGIVILESESNLDGDGQTARFDVRSNLPFSGDGQAKKEHSDGFWHIDFEAAKAKAAKEKKDLLVNFSGIEWCPPCIQLEADVLSKAEFKTEVSKKYVPVLLDFPRDTSKASDQNQRLSKVFGHRYFPTVYLTDPNGRAYGKIVSYIPGGPANYLQRIEEFRKVKVQFSELMATVGKDGLSDVENAKRIEKAILLLDPELLRQFYMDEIKRMVALDKDNVAGLKGKYGFTSLMWEVVDLQVAGDFAGALKAVNAGEKEMKLAGVQLQQMLYMKSEVLFALADKAGSMESLKGALAAAPDGPMADRIKEIIDKYFGDQ